MKVLSQPECRRQILDRIGRLREDSPRQWGTMTARQMVCHLNDSFLGVMGQRHISTDHEFRHRRFIKWFALYVPLQWPHSPPTRPEIDCTMGGTPPEEFEADRARLIALVERFSARPRDFAFRPHPMFLEMSEWEWMRWGYLHPDHHLRQFSC